jgi:nicotinamidase-related amidase
VPLKAAGAPPAKAALILIDVITDYAFPDGQRLRRAAPPALARIVALRRRLHAAGIPVIYANDNRGRWRSDFRELTARSVTAEAPAIADLLPGRDDYFVLKPKQSGFYATPLAELLHHLGTRTVVLAGLAGDGCVLCTAIDAHLRGYRVIVPRDCVASVSPARNRRALQILAESFGIDTRSGARITRRTLRATGRAAR